MQGVKRCRASHPQHMLVTYLLLIAALLLLAISLAVFCVFMLYALAIGFAKGAPFVRTRRDRMKTMLSLAAIKPGETVIDLGSGDGTLLLEAARLGANAIGVELNPFLVWYSRARAKKSGLGDRIRVIRKNFFSYPLGHADVVFLYLLTTTNDALRGKLEQELKPGTRVISNTFPINGWTPTAHENSVFRYGFSSTQSNTPSSQTKIRP